MFSSICARNQLCCSHWFTYLIRLPKVHTTSINKRKEPEKNNIHKTNSQTYMIETQNFMVIQCAQKI
jgi:hypothetical protein